MRRWLGALALIALAGKALAGEDGGQPLAFSKMPVGARSAAMGQAGGAVGGDAYGMVANPALLATLQDLRLGSQWATLPTGRSQQFLSFGRPIDKGSDTGYGLAYDRSSLETGIERRRANTPDPESVFGESASIFTIGLGGWFWPQKLAGGANVKILAQTLGDASGGGFSGDFGLFLRTWPWLDLGLCIQDVASRFTWNTGTSDPIPLVVRSSAVAKSSDDRWRLAVDIDKSQVQDLHLKLGTELWFWPKLFALRAGWSQGQWSGGLGLETSFTKYLSNAGIDYAIIGDPLGDGAMQQRISLNVGVSLD